MRPLDVAAESKDGRFLRSKLEDRIIGQKAAIDALVGIWERYKSGLYNRTRPVASMLLLGPTGCGKTRIAEALAEAIHNDPNAILKIDCGEYQHSQEIAKLIGSPPGYLGHRETPPAINTERINKLKGKEDVAIILFDEIEKASDALWHILLGVLDKGALTLGTNEKVDLTKTIIVMTSNAGTAEMAFALGNRLGFSHAENASVNDAEIAGIGEKAAKRKFTSEFINRLNYVIGCNALTKMQAAKIVDLELDRVQANLLMQCTNGFKFRVSDRVKSALLEEGFDPKMNARNVRRVIERRIEVPLSRIVSNGHCAAHESVYVSFVDGEFSFSAY